MGCKLDLWSILDNFKNTNLTSPPGVELKNSPFEKSLFSI